jgi:uncharacterized protein YutE (UPF0331/DUF86 family)
MNTYIIEQKISTLAEYDLARNNRKQASFCLEDIEFSDCEIFSFTAGCIGYSWIANTKVEAENFKQAHKYFIRKLSKIIPRISLVLQTYIEYLSEPLLIYKNESSIAFFRYIRNNSFFEVKFKENDLKALEILIREEKVSDEFFYYWKDFLNATGYSAKLLLIFSAIEALAKQLVRQSKQKGKKKTKGDFEKEILGDELYKECFEKTNGLRNKLAHGDYFQLDYFQLYDFKNDYVETIYKKVINYFNKKIFKEILIKENVDDPLKRFWFNKEKAKFFIKIKNKNQKFSLKEVLNELKGDNFFNNSQKYEYVNLSKEEIEKY